LQVDPGWIFSSSDGQHGESTTGEFAGDEASPAHRRLWQLIAGQAAGR